MINKKQEILEKHCPSMNSLFLDKQGKDFRNRILKAMEEYKQCNITNVVGRSEQLIADLYTIEACYDVEFGDMEKAAEYIIAKGD